MQIPSAFAGNLGTSASAAFGLLGRIAQSVQPLLSPGAAYSGVNLGGMTPERVRAALLEMGLAAADADVELAETLVQAGLPLTVASLAEAHGELARAVGASPQSYVVAKTLELPTSPDTLRALTTALNAAGSGEAFSNALPEQVRVWLGLGVEASTPPEAQARHLREMLQQIGRSTEHRLLAAEKDPEHGFPISDMRTSLLRLAQSSGDRSLRTEADSMAKLLEGQQLLNQAGQRAHEGQGQSPLYFAVPLGFDGMQTLAETCLWLPKKADAENDEEEEAVLRVTLRVAPPRLGRVQIDLIGSLTGSLSCRLGAEKLAAVRLLGRHTELLATALGNAGWTTCDVACRQQTEWLPLWPGAETFTTPRASVDWFV